MVKIMAVYDEDPLFAERLADYANQKGKLPFTAMAFSSLERLLEYACENPVEILLVGEGARDKVEGVRAKQVMVLCEGEMTEKREDTAPIYKYQSGDGIMREVMASYCGFSPEPGLALLGRKAVVAGIYSPVNRCMKSSLALTVGQQLSRSMSVLYMNLEEYSGFSRLVGGEYETDLSDVLYLYRQGTFNWMKLKSMVYTRGSMDYIPPVRYGEDLGQIEPEDMAMLIGRIARESGYDRLVVDIGHMGRGALPLLGICDVIYMPVLDDCISAARLEEFEDYLAAADDGSIRDKIQKLRLPRPGTVFRRESYMEQLMWGELGDYVRQLLGNGP
ncbi:MAG: hypothetical protein ACI4F3_11140 [Enterocloster sp.]